MKVDKHKVVAASDKKSIQVEEVTQVKSSEAKRRKELIDSRL